MLRQKDTYTEKNEPQLIPYVVVKINQNVNT
jgi:hypothetical protein